MNRCKRRLKFIPFSSFTLFLPIYENLCHSKDCKVDQVEDEVHFILQCPKYHSDRQTLFSSFNIVFPDDLSQDNLFKLIVRILNPSNNVECYSLYKYLKNALSIRE